VEGMVISNEANKVADNQQIRFVVHRDMLGSMTGIETITSWKGHHMSSSLSLGWIKVEPVSCIAEIAT
jgi:hypothetical protein